MRVIDSLLADVTLPKMVRVRQHFDETEIPASKIPEVVAREMEHIRDRVRPGMKIAVPAGSRGVANIALIIRSVVETLRAFGAEPYVFPAMGSHGGASADGQREVIESYGITEAYIGCPIISSMETVEVGTCALGEPVFVDKHAFEADGIFLIGRVKAHTSFHDTIESGLMKMAVVGCGKQKGADQLHKEGIGMLGKRLPYFAEVLFEKVNFLGGLATIENAHENTYMLKCLTKEEIPEKEPELLLLAKEKMGRLLFDKIEVLVVDELGKDISGDGMDPNVTGVYATKGMESAPYPQHVVVLDVTDVSHGNINGLGMANVTTKRLFDKIDMEISYPNAITSTGLWTMKIPMVARTDAEAVKIAVKTSLGMPMEAVRVIRIKNTLRTDDIWISENLLPEAKKHPDIEIIGEPEAWPFDAEGNLF